jgi:CHAT domain-containing protein
MWWKGYGRLLLLLPALLLPACQAAMSGEQAKDVSVSFSGKRVFVPPPRTITDITAILDSQKLADPRGATLARAAADQPPPKTAEGATLATFYYRRGLAAREIGRTRQEISDLTEAVRLAPSSQGLFELARSEYHGGNLSRATDSVRESLRLLPWSERGRSITINSALSWGYALAGNLAPAEAALAAASRILAESRSWPAENQRRFGAFWHASHAKAQAVLAEIKGDFAKAEDLSREAFQLVAEDPIASRELQVEVLQGDLAEMLARRGRLLEAEEEARKALVGALRKQGRDVVRTGQVVKVLANVLAQQGRFGEAEALARAAIDIYQRAGAPADSYNLARAREVLGAALVGQGRWKEALAECEAIRAGLASDPDTYNAYFAGSVTCALPLLQTGRAQDAEPVLRVALERSRRIAGDAHPMTGQIRGLLAMTSAALGDHARALKDFAEVTRILLSTSQDGDDETTIVSAQDQRLSLILTAYLGLLADVKGTELERRAGIDAMAEAFRLADVTRARRVQRAIDAAAARAAAKTPGLADLVRKEQDARMHVGVLYGILTNALSLPSQDQDPEIERSLRDQIGALNDARKALRRQIRQQFPAYAQLIRPEPATLEDARTSLRPGEALLTTLVSEDRAFIWAVPQRGVPAFAAIPIGQAELSDRISRLRLALEPQAQVLGEIPAFDLQAAHELYRMLLQPVRSGWGNAESLLVVPHGPLGQLPFGVLPTGTVTLGKSPDLLFSAYRSVPWLIRTHAITVLPSVTALRTLRGLPAGNPGRRPFVGFGDPYFSVEQARAADRPVPSANLAAATVRGSPIFLRGLQVERRNSMQVKDLPRLPDTRDEIEAMARAMNADLSRDVFVGAAANEENIRETNLGAYRVIAFATHGLVAGDLDGLTQPALALTAPEVTKIEGDGLLTMEKILVLQLNADWVILSACNTASADGSGAEAISGLGRAFFYAGARALLVSSWPVETRATRALTTDISQRQATDTALSRARALQKTMMWMIDEGGVADPATGAHVFSYAHPIFWAPFSLVGDGG